MKLLKISLIILTVLFSAQVIAQEAYTPFNFKLTFLGTRYRSDIETIKANLTKSPLVKNFTPIVISQRHIQYEGQYTGTPEDLIADITSLSQNRFGVESKKAKGGDMIITLRKLDVQAPAPQQ